MFAMPKFVSWLLHCIASLFICMLALFAIVVAIFKDFLYLSNIDHQPPLLPSMFEHLEISFNFILSICWTEWNMMHLCILSVFITDLLLMIIHSIVFEWGLLQV